MKSYSWVVISRAKEGQVEAFEHWYDTSHLPEVCAVPGVKGARRYKVAGQNEMGCRQPAWDSVAIYDFEGDDPDAVMLAIRDAWSKGMTVTDAMAPEGIQIVVSQASSI